MRARDTRLRHHAHFYSGEREYLERVLAAVRDGTAGCEPMLIAVPGRSGRLVRSRLGGEAGRPAYLDMAEVGRNPARLIPEFAAFIGRHPGKRVRLITEPAWPGRNAAELCEAARHEALVDVAFAAAAATIVCLYDAGGLDRPVISRADCTHAAVLRDGALRESRGYRGPGRLPADCEQPLLPPPPQAEQLGFRADLRSVRQLVALQARQCRLSEERESSLVLAVSELAANTLRHTQSPGTLHVWRTAQELICQVADRGWIADPLAGRIPPSVTGSGHGLWVVNQICDLVEMRTGHGGTTIRLHMRIGTG